jgi:hypothetical protein
VYLQVVIRCHGAVLAGILAVATLEDLWPRAVGQDKRLRRQSIVVELVEVALERKVVLRPDALEALDELTAFL